jgi:hypothetical protein
VELQSRLDTIKAQGLGLVAISYDPPATLKAFADSRGITFPMISDPGSAIIKRYGLLNETQDPQTRFYGIPHPGTFILDAKGVVVARFFEDAYQERYTTAAMFAARGLDLASGAVTGSTAHLSLRATISDTEQVAPGQRLTIVVQVTPRPRMHLYAPGKHDYQVVQLTLNAQAWLRAHETQYPPSEIYHFKPLDERVEVYARPFRLTRDITLLATQEAQKQLGALSSVTVTGALEYQACDDAICFNPAKVPIAFTLSLRPLDRRPPG